MLMVAVGAVNVVSVRMHSNTVAILLFVAMMWPTATLVVRRWHDLGRSGWYILLQGVPIVGFWCFYVLAFRRGEQGDNRFGADPVLA